MRDDQAGQVLAEGRPDDLPIELAEIGDLEQRLAETETSTLALSGVEARTNSPSRSSTPCRRRILSNSDARCLSVKRLRYMW
jgi:hypothetical protein